MSATASARSPSPSSSAVYVAVRHLRGARVGLLGFASPTLTCLFVVGVVSGGHRFATVNAVALYGIALPAFLAIFPLALLQVVQLLPSAVRGLLGGERQWKRAAPTAALGVVAAVAVFLGGHQVGASGEIAQLNDELSFNTFNGVRAAAYLGAAALLYLSNLRPLVTVPDVCRAQGLGLAFVLMVVLGEIAGVGVGMYGTATYLDNLPADPERARVQLVYMTALLRVEHVWGVIAAIATFATWYWLCRRVWVPTSGETVRWLPADRMTVVVCIFTLGMLMFGALTLADYEAIYLSMAGG